MHFNVHARLRILDMPLLPRSPHYFTALLALFLSPFPACPLAGAGEAHGCGWVAVWGDGAWLAGPQGCLCHCHSVPCCPICCSAALSAPSLQHCNPPLATPCHPQWSRCLPHTGAIMGPLGVGRRKCGSIGQKVHAGAFHCTCGHSTLPPISSPLQQAQLQPAVAAHAAVHVQEHGWGPWAAFALRVVDGAAAVEPGQP